MSEDEGIAGHFIIGDGLQQGTPRYVTIEDDGFHVTPYGQKVLQDLQEQLPRGAVREQNTTTQVEIQCLAFRGEDELRAFIRDEVRKALEEDAREIATNPAFQPVDTHQHRRVEMTEENGLHWRGVLYATNAEPLSGVCWGCLKPGDDMQWYSRDGRSHLIHKSEECRQLADEKQETTEHRG